MEMQEIRYFLAMSQRIFNFTKAAEAMPRYSAGPDARDPKNRG